MTLHVLRENAGTLPIVLLHGFPLDHRMWLELADELEAPHTLLAVDLPGAGGRAEDLPSPSIEAAADAVAAELTAAGVSRAVVAGLSMGGYVALALAERHPGLVAALGLLDTKSTADPDDARVNRLRIAVEAESSGTVDAVRPMATSLVGESTRSARPEVSEQLAAWIDEQAPAGVAWAQRAMASRPDRTHVLREFAGAVTLVVGDEDQVTPVSAAEHMATAAPGAQLVVVPRAGHMSAVEQPADVAEALSELAQRVETA